MKSLLLNRPLRRTFVGVLALGLTLGFGLTLLSALPASAVDTTTRGITVQGTGTVKMVPDAIRISVTTNILQPSSNEALSQSSGVAAAIRKVLTANAIATKDITTARINVNPEYIYSQDKAPAISGYRATQNFSIVVRKTANAGTILDQIVESAGDNAIVDGATPFLLDSKKAMASARTLAVKAAKAKATTYAKLLGVKLTTVQYLNENTSFYNPMPIAYATKASADSAPTQIDVGQQDVSISVEVRWNLK
ncbi:MAG: SIMPL domain-containing protein [Actinobacteria bacterium]|nr:SIMPL domain-containing protein [Actinomycetota bacterium]